jgi:hypothetical protein
LSPCYFKVEEVYKEEQCNPRKAAKLPEGLIIDSPSTNHDVEPILIFDLIHSLGFVAKPAISEKIDRLLRKDYYLRLLLHV